MMQQRGSRLMCPKPLTERLQKAFVWPDVALLHALQCFAKLSGCHNEKVICIGAPADDPDVDIWIYRFMLAASEHCTDREAFIAQASSLLHIGAFSFVVRPSMWMLDLILNVNKACVPIDSVGNTGTEGQCVSWFPDIAPQQMKMLLWLCQQTQNK